VASVASHLRSWIFGAGPGGAAAAGAARDPSAEVSAAAHTRVRDVSSDAVSTERFARDLRELLAVRPELPYGQINIIGLDKLRDRLGAKWAEVEDKVYAAADRIIRARIGPRDAYTRLSENEFLLIFANIPADVARLKCAKIAEEICAFFLGDPDTQGVTVRTAVGVMDGRVKFEELQLPGLLSTLAGRAEPVDLPCPCAAADANGAASCENARSVRNAAGNQPAPRKGAGAPPRDNDDARPKPLRSMPAPTTENDLWDIADRLPSFEIGGGADPILSFGYRPVWDVRAKLLSTYSCVPVRLFPGYGRRYGYAVLDDRTDSYSVARLDLETLKEGLCMLDELQRNRFQIFMAVPVQFETVATTKFRDVFIEIAQRVPGRMRKFLAIELVHLPEGIPQNRLAEIVLSLKPFCSAVLVRAAIKAKPLSLYADIGIHAVGVDVRREPLHEAELISRLNQFVADAERQKLWTYVHGVQTTSLTMACCAAGVRYVDGDRVGKLAEVPMHVHKYRWEDLLFSDPRG
jgi:hypothetical protein